MPQTVFDVGDPITSRLKLGMTPDPVLTVASVKVYRPTGVELLGLTASGWIGADGDEKTVQWFATDDGTAGGPTLAAAGDWLAVWKVTGPGAAIAPKVYNVNLLPTPGARSAWLPFLSEVADHVPWLTVDTVTVGADAYLGTFTGWTAATDEQAQRHIYSASAGIESLGTLDPAYNRLGRSVIALRAAASLARAFVRYNDNALSIAAALDEQANSDYSTLLSLITAGEGTDTTDLLPVWTFPDPYAYPGDHNL